MNFFNKVANNHPDGISIDKNDYDEYSWKRKEMYGKCPTCNRFNTGWTWCDQKLLTEGRITGNKTLDELFKSTQLKAGDCYNDYIQWVPYNDLANIEKVGDGEF